MAVTFAGYPCVLPDGVLRGLAARRPPIPSPWAGKPNSYECPRGTKPGPGWILLAQSQLNALNLNSTYPLVFSQNGRTVIFPSLLIVKGDAVNPSNQYNPNTPYLVELADRRLLYQGIPINQGFNVRSSWAPSVTYYAATLNSGVEYTWSQMIQTVWQLISGLGTFPGLPFTPNSTPEGFSCYGMSAMVALGAMLDRIGCTLTYDPIADVFSIEQIGTDAASEFASADSAAQSYKVWDDYTQESAQARMPQYVRVLFPKQPMPLDGSGPWYNIDVADTSPATGVAAGTYVTVKDDLPASYSVVDQATAATVVAGGTGYAVNDTITIAGGTFTTATILKVTSIGGGGVITGVSVQTAGSYTDTPADPGGQASTSGAGTGATFTITWATLATLTNSAALTSRANERGADWFRIRKTGQLRSAKPSVIRFRQMG